MDNDMVQRAMSLQRASEDVEQQLAFVNEQLSELEDFKGQLATLDESKEEDMLASVGKGVFAPVKRKRNEKLYVQAGAGVVVRKTPEEAGKIIGEQIKKFREARMQLTQTLEEHMQEFRRMVSQMRKG